MPLSTLTLPLLLPLPYLQPRPRLQDLDVSLDQKRSTLQDGVGGSSGAEAWESLLVALCSLQDEYSLKVFSTIQRATLGRIVSSNLHPANDGAQSVSIDYRGREHLSTISNQTSTTL